MPNRLVFITKAHFRKGVASGGRHLNTQQGSKDFPDTGQDECTPHLVLLLLLTHI